MSEVTRWARAVMASRGLDMSGKSITVRATQRGGAAIVCTLLVHSLNPLIDSNRAPCDPARLRARPFIYGRCAHVMLISQPAYEAMSEGGVCQLPHPRTYAALCRADNIDIPYTHNRPIQFKYIPIYIKFGICRKHSHRVQKEMGNANGEAGHSDMLYNRVANFASRLSDQDRDTCCLIYDEINTVGDLAFKIVNGEYVFYGLVSESIRTALFIPPKGATVEEALKAKQATHALVFQVTTLSAVKFRFVCGIHPVASLTSVVLEQLFWETVKNLYFMCCITIVVAVSDGAGCNRLFQKAATSDYKRGSANTFELAWCWNYLHEDLNAKIFFISDPSHLVKKVRNRWWKSNAFLPDFLVQLVLQLFEPPGPDGAQKSPIPAGSSAGEECFARVFGRLYDLMASSHQPPYYHGREPLGQPDPRIAELLGILALIRAWHKYNLAAYGNTNASNKPRPAWHFLSHQLYFDTQLMIEGFVGLLTYLEQRDGVIRIIARKINQDSLESLFGHIRFNCGSGRDPNIFRVVHSATRVEDQRLQKAAQRKAYRARTNSGQAGSSEPVNGGTSWLDGHRIRMPADLEVQTEAAIALLPGGPPAHPVKWVTLRDFQDKDEKNAKRGIPRKMHWLHKARDLDMTGFALMKVGPAVRVVSIKTAKQMRLHRRGELYPVV
jgi:hypothetical protein